MPKTENHEPLFAEMPQNLFLSKLKRYFSFMQLLSRNSEIFLSVIIKNNAIHIATPPAGTVGYTEIPITIVKPSHYRNSDLNKLIHSVVHTYHPEITEPTNVHYQGMEQINTSFEVNHLICIKIQSLTIFSVMYKQLKS